MRSLAFILLLFLLVSTPALAQESTGRIEGRVTDPAGAPIAGATVTATGPGLLGQRLAETRPDGYFDLLALPVGAYDVRIAAAGYREKILTGSTVRLGATTGLGDVTLESQAHELEPMVVMAAPPLVDPSETTLGGNLIAEEFRELPIDRSYEDLTLLMPHVLESYLGDGPNFAGGTGMENKWYVDGVDVTSMMYGWDAMQLPYNFVQEVQVRSGGYQAEYPGAQGGVVDVITPSGSNEVRGQVFGYFLDDQLTGTPSIGIGDPDEGSFARWDVGASVGGPLQRDRLWYFLAYNPAFDHQETAIPGQAPSTDKTTTHRFAAKLDWLIDDANDLTLSVAGDPGQGNLTYTPLNPTALANPDPALLVQESSTIMTSLRGRHFVGENSLLQPTLSAVWNHDRWEPRTERGRNEILLYDWETGVISGGTMFRDGANYQDGLDLKAGLDATLPLGAHSLKVGAEYRRIAMDVKDDSWVLERDLDESSNEYFLLTELWTHGEIRNRLPAAFVQDSWRFGGRLRLNYGVRWSGQYLVDSEGSTAVRIGDQWQPRFGATYLIGSQRRAKVFGSFGRYYQDLSLNAPSGLLIADAGAHVTFFDHDPRVDPSFGTVVWSMENALIDDLRGQHYDEFTLGYERQVGERGLLTVRGVYRELREAIEDAWSEAEGKVVWGNPGRGLLADYPRPSRDYSALEFTYQLTGGRRVNALVSYVLSRTRGNTSGIFASDYSGGGANVSPQWDDLSLLVNGHGLLPNDRTHVVKLAGSWRSDLGLTVGATFAWMRGTPLNEFGTGPAGTFYNVFLVPRGTAGRTPDIWDLNLRLTYDLAALTGWETSTRLVCDLLHLGSPRKVTNFDQKHYLGRDVDGNQIQPSPTYGLATEYQPPFAARLGVTVDF